MRITVIRIISVQITTLIITAFGEPQKLNKINITPVPDSLQNRFGFFKSLINNEPSVFLPPRQFTSFLRPDEITGDEMKTILFAESKQPKSAITANDYPDRTPESLPPVPPPPQHYSPHPPATVFQLLKGQLTKSIPSIKAYLLTKDLQFPKLNQLPFPLKIELPVTQQSVPHKHKLGPIWSYLKPKSLMHTDSSEPRPESVIEQPKPTVYYMSKSLPMEPQIIKEEPITLYLNKFAVPESPDSLKTSPESEHTDQPIYKEAMSIGPKPVDSLDAIQSQYNEQYTKHVNQIPIININEFPINSPASQTTVNDFYGSPYLQNPHIVVTRPYSPTWVPNAKKWYPGTHKSAFYPDTRIIKFTINDRIYNNSTKKPNYVTRMTPKLTTTTTEPPIPETDTEPMM